jgi:hypothetical protein
MKDKTMSLSFDRDDAHLRNFRSRGNRSDKDSVPVSRTSVVATQNDWVDNVTGANFIQVGQPRQVTQNNRINTRKLMQRTTGESA